MLERRLLGTTGMTVSVLGFGCGAVGGLMVKGDAALIDRAIGTAVAAGINYFDTAQMYGDGASENNLGAALQRLKPDVLLGSKVNLRGADFADIESAIVTAAELSLKRLQRDTLDLYQLHNSVSAARDVAHARVGVHDLEAVARGFERLMRDGKIRFWGINGLGDSTALHQAVASAGAHTIQCCYNLLNASAGLVVPPAFAFQNYRFLMQAAVAHKMGVIGIRILAGGALTGEVARHPLAMQVVDPIASSASFEADVALARHFAFLVRQGWATSLADAAIRFAISQPLVSTALLGTSSIDQLQQGIAAAQRGPLPVEALARVAAFGS